MNFSFRSKHPLTELVEEWRPSQPRDIMLLLIKNSTQWVGYPRIAQLGIGPVSTKISEARKRIKGYGYGIDNQMKYAHEFGRRKIYSSFKLIKL